MLNNLTDLLKTLKIESTGRYDDQYYIIKLENSDEYAKMYSHLNNVAVNIEYPYFIKSTTGTATRIMNYFELENSGHEYKLFLIADFKENLYYLKIGEK